MTLIKIIARFIRHLYRSCGFLLTSVTMMANQPQFRHKYGKKLTMFSWDAKWFWVRPITFLLSLVLPYSCFSYKVIKLYSHRLTLYRNNPITDYINLKLIFSLFKTHLLITENQTQFQIARVNHPRGKLKPQITSSQFHDELADRRSKTEDSRPNDLSKEIFLC